MSDSAIEWTDKVWNPVRGCVKVSPGCAHCYAETFAERFRGVKGHPYEQGFDLRLVPEKLAEPLSWKKPRRVFVNSMSDLFQDGVPDEYIDRVFAVMANHQRHIFQLLTKRAERMREYVTTLDSERLAAIISNGDAASEPWARKVLAGKSYKAADYGLTLPLPNVWLGVSVENQHFADERIPLLLQTPAAVRFISAEPLLGPIDLDCYVDVAGASTLDPDCENLDWVIVGGESGPGARPFDVAWARSLVQQCRAAGISCFVKQLGANPIQLDGDHRRFVSRKGGDPTEWPDDLRVREFPEVRV